MEDYLKTPLAKNEDYNFPLGSTIVDHPHSVCVSLPTMADIIGYEERDPVIMRKIYSGYPRFVEHEWILELRRQVAKSLGVSLDALFLLPSEMAAKDCIQFVGAEASIQKIDEGWAVVFDAPDPDMRTLARQFMRHTGCCLSSREAEVAMVKSGYLSGLWPEERIQNAPMHALKEIFCGDYPNLSQSDVFLARGGMNAFYGAFLAISQIQGAKARHRWIQLGWLYVDTIAILEKMSGGCFEAFYDVTDLTAVESYIQQFGDEIAGLVTEIPTNPMVKSADVVRLHQLCREKGIALVLDPSLLSPRNAPVLAFADVQVCSLTKYFSSAGDVLMGAVALNEASPFYSELKQCLPSFLETPCLADVERLAWSAQRYEIVGNVINANTLELVRFLEMHPSVETVYWACQADSSEAFHNAGGSAERAGGVFSFTLKSQAISDFYDRLALAKSPSFGITVTLVCPFIYLAHYDLITSKEGQSLLEQANIPPNLIRVSVGTEPIDWLIQRFESALA
jgi:cystathionine gamma-synthase